jgi:hypothetical protein
MFKNKSSIIALLLLITIAIIAFITYNNQNKTNTISNVKSAIDTVKQDTTAQIKEANTGNLLGTNILFNNQNNPTQPLQNSNLVNFGDDFTNTLSSESLDVIKPKLKTQNSDGSYFVTLNQEETNTLEDKYADIFPIIQCQGIGGSSQTYLYVKGDKFQELGSCLSYIEEFKINNQIYWVSNIYNTNNIPEINISKAYFENIKVLETLSPKQINPNKYKIKDNNLVYSFTSSDDQGFDITDSASIDLKDYL